MKKLLIGLAVCVVIGFSLWFTNRPVSEYLTVERLEENMATGGRLVLVGETCYELDGEESLAGFCDFSHWYEGKGKDPGQRLLTVHIGDQYELAFYENGWAKAYDGYASWTTRDTVWYKVTEQDTEEMIEYIQANAMQKVPFLGPESWFVLHD